MSIFSELIVGFISKIFDHLLSNHADDIRPDATRLIPQTLVLNYQSDVKFFSNFESGTHEIEVKAENPESWETIRIFPSESTLPFTERRPLITETVKYILLQDDTLRSTVAELEQRLNLVNKIVPITNLRSKRIHLTQQLPAILEYENGVWVASSPDLNLYGSADTEQGAIRDLAKEIENLYFELKKHKGKLGKAMEESWYFLKEIVKETSHGSTKKARV